MSLVFYYAPMTSPMIIHWALEELGVPYEKVTIDLEAGEQNKPDFLQVNPNAKVPVLVHDGVSIVESAAILIHLGETFGVDKGLFPAPGLARAEALKWIIWCSVALAEANSRFHRNFSERFPAEQRNVKAGELAKQDVHALLDILDRALAGRTYLVGDDFSLADLHLSSWVSYLGRNSMDLAPYAAIAGWNERCSRRPANPRRPAG